MTTLEYHRPVRNYPALLEPDTLPIASPPPLPPKVSGSFLQFIVPLIGALGSVAFILVSKISPLTLIATGAMLLASVGGGALIRVQQAHAQKQRLKRSREKYAEYLAEMRRRLGRDADKQRQIMETLYPQPKTLLTRMGGDRLPERLWERQWHDPDFLEARIGTGYVPLYHTIVPPTHAATALDVDVEMDEAARTLQSDFQILLDMPVVIALRHAGSVAICGAGDARRELARAMLAGLTFNHAPNDLRILLYAPPEAMTYWSWLKWLPHTRALRHNESVSADEPELLCMMVDTVDDFANLLDRQVLPEFERRTKAREDHHGETTTMAPHFLILVDGYAPRSAISRLSPLMQIMERVTADANQANEGVGVTVLSLTESRDTAPSALFGRVEILASGTARYEEARMKGHHVEAIRPDPLALAESEDLARALAPITLGNTGAEADLSREVRLLPLLELSPVDAIEAQNLWPPKNPNDMMCLPIGLAGDGKPIILNLREPAEQGMGPHGMVVGQPGMGKSEFLRTLVLGLAATHSPEQVNFVFVDFKGATAFADLATLPHCVGLVTRVEADNSGDLVERLLQSLQGERARRAELLGNARVEKISQYQALETARPELQPLPYLVIVIDEYAALLQQHQELKLFFKEIGQQGRSLGMNMILVSQSPSGGNLPELEEYLTYRISMRTATQEASNAALGTPDAYFLPAFIPGLAYLKVGQEIYRKFRVARSTTPFHNGVQSPTADAQVRMFNHVGALVPLNTDETPHVNGASAQAVMSRESAPTELSVMAQLLLSAAEKRHWSKPRQVWTPPLRRIVTLGQIAAAAQTPLLDPTRWAGAGPGALSRVPIGLADHVREQQQTPYLYDFTGHAGHLVVVGAPTSGASTLLKTIVAALISTTTPRHAQFYLIDAGGGRLDAFSSAPHVGGVCSGREAEVVRRMTAQVRGMLRRREERFRRERIGGIGVFREMRATLPPDDADVGADVFLVIDNLNALRQEAQGAGYDGELLSDLAAIVGTGLTYGIHLIISAQNDPPAAIAGNIGGRIELRLPDPRMSSLGKTSDGTQVASLVATDVPGRGVVAGPYLFQAALPIRDSDDKSIEALMNSIQGQIEQRCASSLAIVVKVAQDHWTGPSASPVRLLPPRVTEEDLLPARVAPGSGFILGMEEATFEALALDLTHAGPHLLIYGDLQHGKTSLLRLMIAQLQRMYTPDEARFILIDPRRGLVECTDSAHLLRSGDLFGYACTKEMLDDCITLAKQHLDPRKASSGRPTLEELRVGKTWSGPRIFVFFDDYEPNGVLGTGPLNGFGELTQQTSDIGFHLILTRQLADSSRGIDQAILDRVRNTGSPAIVMGSDTLGVVPGNYGRGKSLPAGRAFLVRQRHPVTIMQVAYRPSQP